VDFWRSNKALHRLNDVSLENGYSVIEDPKPLKGHYGTWLGERKEPSSREILEQIIDKALAQNPTTFEDSTNGIPSRGSVGLNRPVDFFGGEEAF